MFLFLAWSRTKRTRSRKTLKCPGRVSVETSQLSIGSSNGNT